jgi:hypothetical protein
MASGTASSAASKAGVLRRSMTSGGGNPQRNSFNLFGEMTSSIAPPIPPMAVVKQSLDGIV